MVATNSRRRILVVAVASVVSLLVLVVASALLTIRARGSSESQDTDANSAPVSGSSSDSGSAKSVNICRVYAVDVLMADRFGNLQGSDDAGYFECELVVLEDTAADDNSNKNIVLGDNSSVEDIYFTVRFSEPVVQANAVALEHDEWFVQYEKEWVVRNGKSLVFPSDESVVTVRPDQVERRLRFSIESHAQVHPHYEAQAAMKKNAARDRNRNSGIRIRRGGGGSDEAPQLHQNYQQYQRYQHYDLQYPQDALSHTGTRHHNKMMRHRRHLVSDEARNKIIIVRVTTADRQVMYNATELAEFVFGATEDSLQAQYYSCSHGAVDYQPYDPTEPVFEVRVQYGVDDYTFDDIFREANPIVKAMVGGTPLGDLVEHVMYVVPSGLGSDTDAQGADGADFEAVSVASLNHFKGMYVDQYFSQIGALLHQTAHNKGLGHAWQGDDEYGDTTGAMGKGEPGVEKVCFNGLHASHLEWMTDKTVRVDGMVLERRIELISYVDYDSGLDGQAVILIVEPFYLTYNLKKGFNRETLELEDEVLIVRREFRSPDSIATNLVASLHPNKTTLFTEEAFFSSGQNLAIEVCEVTFATARRPDSITVAVGTERNPCNPVPSAMPSNVVSMAPSVAPAPRPAGGAIPIFNKELNNFVRNSSACEDSNDIQFFVNVTLGHQRCSWLRQNRNGMHDATRTNKEFLCVESNDAYHFCEEECGKCTDDCNDDPTAVFQLAGRESNCEYLSGKGFLWTLACKHEEIALVCKETCETCGE
jgi:hypothetical protein